MPSAGLAAVGAAVPPPVRPAPRPARLDLRFEPATARTILDGAWWPATRDAATELAGLVIALDAEHVAVNLLMLNPDGWHHRPRSVSVAGRVVRVAWTADLDRAVLLATTDHRRIDLLVGSGPAAATHDRSSGGRPAPRR